MSEPDILLALTPVVETLDELGVRYQVGGSLASSAYGVGRSTADADLVADLHPEHAGPLTLKLQSEYYIDEQMIRDAIADRSTFNLIHLSTMLKVDVFILSTTRYDTQAFERAKEEALTEAEDSRRFYIAAPEDVVLNKLRWYHYGRGASDQQWRDVIGVLKVQAATLDRAYLRKWAMELGLQDLLSRAMKDAGIE